jgi:hypothetical protein
MSLKERQALYELSAIDFCPNRWCYDRRSHRDIVLESLLMAIGTSLGDDLLYLLWRHPAMPIAD